MKETMTSPHYHKRESLPVLVAALVVSVGLIAFTAWFWDLIHIFTPFLMPLLMGAMWVIFLGVGVWSLLHVCRSKRFRKPRAYTPLVVQIVSVVIVLTVPFTSIMLDLDFRLRLKQREEVVSKVASGELKPNVPHNSSLIHLSSQHRRLSKGGGDIIVDGTSVFFFTYRGILDNFSGFVYRSDDTPPKDGDFGGMFFEIKRLKQNWYWVGAH